MVDTTCGEVDDGDVVAPEDDDAVPVSPAGNQASDAQNAADTGHQTSSSEEPPDPTVAPSHTDL
jgi:hypothetical protein